MKKNLFLVVGIALFVLQAQSALALPSNHDTDGDGIPDTQEDANANNTFDPGETDPYDVDTDGGGESDGSEIQGKRNPLDKTDDLTYDIDGDGWVNGIELLNGTDPKKTDTDGDGVIDSKDAFPADARYSVDTDGNGLPDDWEEKTQLDQEPIPQSKVDDPDNDSLTNAEEFAQGTNPLMTDTDRDGTDDKTEIDNGGNPRESACLQYNEAGEEFPDTVQHWSKPYVSLLRQITILPKNWRLLSGYVQNTSTTPHFLPDQPVTRFEFLKMVMLSTCIHLIGNTQREKAFSDVTNIAPINENTDTNLKRQVIYSASRHRVVAGYDDGTFRPNDPVNRAEAIKMLILAAQVNLINTSGGSSIFSDVLPTDWYAPYVQLAAERGIVSGYSDGTFRSNLPITRAEAAKIIGVVIRQNPLINGYVLPEEE